MRLSTGLLVSTLVFFTACNLRKTESGTALSQAMDGEASERLQYEMRRLSDPATGSIPDHVRQREISYAASLPSEKDVLFRRSGGPVSFVNRGPWNVGGRTRAFGIDVSAENRLLAGSTSGGMWLSADAGKSWKQTTTAQQMLNPTCLVQDRRPGHRQTWFFGTGEAYGASPGAPGAYYLGDGLFRSDDSGKSWNPVISTSAGSAETFTTNWQLVWNLATDISAPDTVEEVYAATYGTIYRSMNGGKTWTIARQGTSYFTDVAVSTKGVVYATLSSDGSHRGIWRSEDGINWTNITPKNFPASYRRIVIGIDPTREDRAYFLAHTPGFGKLTRNYLGDAEQNSFYRYTWLRGNGADSNGQWEDLSMNLPASGGQFDKWNVQGSYDMVVAVSPADSNLVVIGGTNLYRSTSAFSDSTNTRFIGGYEEGSALPQINSYLNHHPDQHGVAFLPSNPGVMYSVHDGGITRTADIARDSVVWENLNNGYLTTQFYTVAVDHGTAGSPVIVGGTQDNGSWFVNSTDPKKPWFSPRGGDGSYCAIEDGGGMYYLSIQNAKMMKARLDANGRRVAFTRIDPIGLKKPKFINPYTLDPNNNNIMYLAGGKYLYRNHDLSALPLNGSWDSISTNWTRWTDSVPTGNSFISAVHAAKTPANRVYYGTDNRRVYRVDNAHTGTPKPVDITSTAIGSVFPSGANVSCITTNPDDGNEVMVAFSNYNVYSIFISQDGGSTWGLAGGNLEPAGGTGPSVRWLAILPVADGKIYFAATSTGLYATTKIDGRNTVWVHQGTETIGYGVCDMIDTRTTDGLVVVATHANGIFSATYNSINNIVSADEIKASDPFSIRFMPNPVTNETVRFSCHWPENNPAEMTITDELGRTLLKQEIRGKSMVEFPVADWKNGVYYLHLRQGSFRKTAGFIISH